MSVRAILAAALLLGLAGGARAAPETGQIETRLLAGTLGATRIGVNLTVRDHAQCLAGHYYYAKYLKDIPLTCHVDGETVVLEEPGGGIFELKFGVDDGAPREAHLTFNNSVKLEGRWTHAGTSLPVTLGFQSSYNGPPSAHLYGEVTEEPDAAFEARVQRFLRAVQAGDRAAAASAVSYPMSINGIGSLVIRDKASLLRHWDAIFTPAYLAKLRQAIPHEMFVRNGQAMVADGAAWFDAKGAAVLNVEED